MHGFENCSFQFVKSRWILLVLYTMNCMSTVLSQTKNIQWHLFVHLFYDARPSTSNRAIAVGLVYFWRCTRVCLIAVVCSNIDNTC